MSVCRVAHGLDWSWMVGVVSNYLDEKLHQPPITDIQPYQHHYTPSEMASQRIYCKDESANTYSKRPDNR